MWYQRMKLIAEQVTKFLQLADKMAPIERKVIVVRDTW